MYCKKCGKLINEELNVCTNCNEVINNKIDVKETDKKLSVKQKYKMGFLGIFPMMILLCCILLAIVLPIVLFKVKEGVNIIFWSTVCLYSIIILANIYYKKIYKNIRFDLYKDRIVYINERKREKIIYYNEIKIVSYNQNIIQKFFNLGNITLHLNKNKYLVKAINMENIEDSEKIYEQIKGIIYNEKIEKEEAETINQEKQEDDLIFSLSQKCKYLYNLIMAIPYSIILTIYIEPILSHRIEYQNIILNKEYSIELALIITNLIIIFIIFLIINKMNEKYEYNFYESKIEYIEKNIFYRKKEIKYKNISNVKISQNPFEKLFGIGKITIETNATKDFDNYLGNNYESNKIILKNIDNLEENYNKIKELVESKRK